MQMDTSGFASFGALLRQHREHIGLAQEELAERAGLSARGISDLERGLRTHPRRDTVRRLADALSLDPADERAFAAAARVVPSDGHAPADDPSALPGRALRHNLPRQLTGLVGRDAASAAIPDLLATAPLVTLIGSGGVGKTRLALAVAEAALPRYPDGVWLVELAPLSDPAHVPQAVASALGVHARTNEALTATLAQALRPVQLLLVLDNCEHLILAAAQLAETLLQACPDLAILATSREALRVPGEVPYRVPSLAFPKPGIAAPLAEVAGAEAVQLFVARGRLSRPDFTLTKANAPLVAQVCAQLDGIPLALELAAARLGVLPLAQLAARLGDPLHLLTGGSRTALPRQQTLRATLEWSYHLLDEAERAAFRRLSTFAGGWTLEAAEAVCAGAGLEAGALADVIVRLVEKSLVSLHEDGEGVARYRFLETVRQYAAMRLDEAGEAGELSARHAAWALAYAESVDTWERPIIPAMLRAFDADRENLQQALDWMRRSDPASGLRLAAVLGQYWNMRGMVGTAKAWLVELSQAERSPSPARARVLFFLATWNTDDEMAAAELTEAIAAARAAGDLRAEVRALGTLGRVVGYLGKREAALAHGEAAVAAGRAAGDRRFIGLGLYYYSQVLGYQGDHAGAEALVREATEAFRQSGDAYALAAALSYLGRCLTARGEMEAAVVSLTESLAMRETLRDQNNFLATLVARSDVALAMSDPEATLAWLARADDVASAAGRHDWDARIALVRGRAWWVLGERHRASTCWRDGLTWAHERGQIPVVTAGLEATALFLADTDPARSARLLGAADALRAARGYGRAPADTLDHDRLVADVQGRLGAAFVDAWESGAALTPDAAVAEALA